ncbi:MAG: DNA-processing protein DprA [Patescibacteria group bacterium]|nr:DNA-processing protein DprA [Patescibacteria group bacterium]MBU2508950.1 DNA-processing protein DprA [Patescibacteria group bacterium]
MEKVFVQWDKNRLCWLTLAWFDGFGARTLRKLRALYSNQGDRAYNVSRETLISLGVNSNHADKFISWRKDVVPEMLARRLDAEKIRFVLECEDEFPSYLKHSSDPPACLFIRGATLQLNRPIAIVGTRAITSYGFRVTKFLSRELALAGCEIISGLALGIDGCAHESVLEVGGKTVAVLANGCSDATIYPRHNFPLAKRIMEKGGSLVSELPPGTCSFKHLFPLRNRIIASLSVATIVVEAAEGSGSLITAKLALEENRDVFAVPGPITSMQSGGTNNLIKLGAIPCTGPEEVLKLFELEQEKPREPIILTDEERSLIDMLDRPLHKDELIRAMEKSPAEISSLLTSLELKGAIEHEGANIYSRSISSH